MNTRNICLAMLCISSLVATSCSKDFAQGSEESIIVSDVSSLDFAEEGASKSINITATSGTWSIDKGSYASWISVRQEGNSIIVTASPNNSGDERHTEISISTESGKRSFLIKQRGASPILSLNGESAEIAFKKEASERSLRLLSNSPDWQVRYLGEAPWLTWERSEDGTAIVLKVKEFLRTDTDATRNRKTTLFVSNGTKHLRLDVLQRGWAQFGEPFFKRGATRDEIIAEELKRGHERQTEYERGLYPNGSDVDKKFLSFSTDGEQTHVMLYEFNTNNLSQYRNKVYLMAPEKKKFEEEDLKAWLEGNGFVASRPKTFPSYIEVGERYTYHYCPSEESTKAYKVFNHERAFLPGSAYYRCARMEYTEIPNDITLVTSSRDNTLQLENFPVRNLIRLHDVRYKLQEVIAYEKSKGMVPDYDSQLSIKSSYPGVEYATLLFKQAQTNTSDGQLVNVLYRFNYPGATDYDDEYKPTTKADLLSHDPLLAGTIGTRMDVYTRQELVYTKRPSYTGELSYITNLSFQKASEAMGFDFVRSDNSGFTTLVRGQDELADITPLGDSKFTIMFYRSKELVDIINKSKPNN